MLNPMLSLMTIYFHDSEKEAAQQLGMDLYAQLTRPIDHPLAIGAGIPVVVAVQANAADQQCAERVVLLPVLGKNSFNLNSDMVLAKLLEWHEAIEHLGKGALLPVPTSQNWRDAENRMPVKHFLTELYGIGDRRNKTVDEIVLAVARMLCNESVIADPEKSSKVAARLFVSHAKADLQATDEAAKKIHDFVVNDSTGKAFYDSVSLHAGESLPDQLDEAVQDGVFVAVRSDAYSSRAWCQRELMRAKLHELPTITVEVLRGGEHRSSPYGGNSPTLVWDGNPARVASRAMVEWLRATFFRLEAKRVCRAADLPGDTRIIARPPELLDLAQGPLRSNYAQLVLHPDPELPVIERQLLKAARPRLQLVTPTTAFRRLLGSNDNAGLATPLENMQIAMSFSDTPDANGLQGFTTEHVIDATLYIARSLISAGAAIAYGGDFRTNGFTPRLALLIQAYNQTASQSAKNLHSYLAANISLDEIPDGLPLKVYHLLESSEIKGEALVPSPNQEKHPAALYVSDMRRVMEKHTAARIILGGQTQPRTTPDGEGYEGRYPGIIEEAWRSLDAKNPLYVLGGFGGAAAIVAKLIVERIVADELQDDKWMQYEHYRQTAYAIDSDPFRERLGLPRSMTDLAGAIINLGSRHLADDASALAWNGLTVAENRILFTSRDPITLASLTLKGLLNKAHQYSSGKLQIELVKGSVASAADLDAMAIAVFDNVPIGGAGAVLDQAIGGKATMERASGRRLMQLESAEIDADWLFLASLGDLAEVDKISEQIERAASETTEQALRHGFRRIGVVAFGGAVVSDTNQVVEAMLRGLARLPPESTIVWFETDDARYEVLQQKLARPGVSLTTVDAELASPLLAPIPEAFRLHVSLEHDELNITALPPAGNAVALSRREPLTAATLEEFTQGNVTPDLDTLSRRGIALSRLLFGNAAEQLLQRCGDSPMIVTHDLTASKIPFELLSTVSPGLTPVLAAGISRRLAVADVPTDRLFAKPPKRAPLNVLLIIDPTNNLPGAAQEGKNVRRVLEGQSDLVSITPLAGKDATVERVSEALAKADVLHYCGHAYFSGPRAGESGLVLANNTEFTAENLRLIPSLPRVAFVNACQAGRVRGSAHHEAAAFAELFLSSGVEAYIGTFWEVQDSAATRFATDVYSDLAAGSSLDAAVLKARRALRDANERDWANYILYGDGAFRLVGR